MTIKEAILKSLEELKKMVNHTDVYNHILEKKYYDFRKAKTPKATISAQLGEFIRNNDTRIKRVKVNGGIYLYYLTKHEQDLNVDEIVASTEETNDTPSKNNASYYERDLHKLLCSYLDSQKLHAKTIFHEKSKNNNDNHQKWIHPDVVGVDFLNLKSKVNNTFMKALNKVDIFKITSYEVKREINTDYELKKSYFQAVSNSSWANYGYLVAFGISTSLKDEIERLNQSFGIGVIELKSNPYESKILFPSKYKELDFKTIDKLCKINDSFEQFIELIEKTLTADERYENSVKNELKKFCDDVFENDSDALAYCKKMNIPEEEVE